MLHDVGPGHDGRLRCARCGDAIGVYELLVYLDRGGEAVRSSLLRLPERLRTNPQGTRFFHASCHRG